MYFILLKVVYFSGGEGCGCEGEKKNEKIGGGVLILEIDDIIRVE